MISEITINFKFAKIRQGRQKFSRRLAIIIKQRNDRQKTYWIITTKNEKLNKTLHF